MVPRFSLLRGGLLSFHLHAQFILHFLSSPLLSFFLTLFLSSSLPPPERSAPKSKTGEMLELQYGMDRMVSCALKVVRFSLMVLFFPFGKRILFRHGIVFPSAFPQGRN